MPPPELLIARCPNCHSSGACWLRDSSRDAEADYFLCDGCGHVWTIGRTSEHQLRHVTPLGLDLPRRRGAV